MNYINIYTVTLWLLWYGGFYLLVDSAITQTERRLGMRPSWIKLSFSATLLTSLCIVVYKALSK